MAGATQWQLPCEHLESMESERTVHSEVSKANADKWADEERTPKQQIPNSQRHIGKKRLTRLLDEYDGTVVVCNSCRRVKALNDGRLREEKTQYETWNHLFDRLLTEQE